MKVKVYEGLKADRFTYIDTNMPYLERYVIKSKWKLTKGDINISKFPSLYGASKQSPQHMDNARYWYVNAVENNRIETRFWDGLSTKNYPFTEIVVIVDTPHGFSVNGESFNYERLSGDIQETIEVFQFEGHRSVPRYHTCNYFVIEDNGAEILHLVPCLTSDNEACMIDLISGELYRNQGTGAFSVEGEMLYEFETPVIKQVMRKPNVVVRLREWLVPNGGVFQLSYNFSTSIWEYKYQENTSVVSFNDLIDSPTQGVMINRNMGYWDANIRDWVFANDKCGDMVAFKAVKDDGFYCNNEKINTTNPPKGTHRNFTNAFTAPIHRIIQDNIHLVPCDLLYHPTLPPQSCMIDLNTGQLYTNQGTGSFTCEGEDLGIWTDTMFDDMRIKETKADMVVVKHNGEPRVVYERVQPFVKHKWLVGDGSAYVDTQINNEQINRVKCNIIPNIPNSTFTAFWGTALYSSTNEIDMRLQENKIRLCCNGRSNLVDIADATDENLYKPWNIDWNTDNVVINGEVKNSPISAVSIRKPFYILRKNNFDTSLDAVPCKIGDFALETNNTTLQLTPIQLTRDLFPHEIASSNTALRGECGFADKEKYLRGEPWFFGNRATSGKFGVSDE